MSFVPDIRPDKKTIMLPTYNLAPTSLSEALQAWEKAIGAEHVIIQKNKLDEYSSNVTGLEHKVPAVLRPNSTQQVQAIVKIANQYKVPISPISRGKNWGLGSRLPVGEHVVSVDLSRMNRIHEVNVEHHYAVVEPGVSQQQLYDYLIQHNLPLVLNVTGSGKDCSLIGNALERGIGYFSSRADSLSGMEIVLGNGEIIQTGCGHFPNAKTTHIYRHGIGPSLDGLFCQSNYGIVTSAGIDLMPKSEDHLSVIASLYDKNKLGEFIDTLASLRKRGIIQSTIHVANKYRTECTVSSLVHNIIFDPKLDLNANRAKTRELIESEGLGPWSTAIGLFGTRQQLKIAKNEIRRSLRRFSKVSFLTDQWMSRAKRMVKMLDFIPYFRRKKAALNAIEPLYGLTQGIPTDAALGSLYWPVHEKIPTKEIDPDLSRCGMLFCLPIMPLSGDIAAETMRYLWEACSDHDCKKHKFIPCVTFNIIDSKTLEAVISINFDKRNTEQTGRAHQCLDAFQQYFMEQGYIPYRVGIQSMDKIVKENDPFWKTVRDLKKVLDPNNIIAPGRYNLV